MLTHRRYFQKWTILNDPLKQLNNYSLKRFIGRVLGQNSILVSEHDEL